MGSEPTVMGACIRSERTDHETKIPSTLTKYRPLVWETTEISDMFVCASYEISSDTSQIQASRFSLLIVVRCLTTLSVGQPVKPSDRVIVDNELERMWKEPVVA
jgi:hypothetical protein